jgi:bifunctional non-homologous end joining protein LigD
VFIEPMAARAVQQLPEGREWLYELKLDGYRSLLLKDGESIRILSRKDNDLTRSYPSIVRAAAKLEATRVTLDGEIVALDEAGRPSFQALQHPRKYRGSTVYYAFDVLHLEGQDLTALPLQERRSKLPDLVDQSGILVSQALKGSAAQIIEAVRGLQLEGVIAKRLDSVYEPGQRSGAWVKLKLDRQQEFVIGGYRPNSASVDTLLIGYYDGKDLHFAAKVKAGFVPHNRSELFRQLQPLKQQLCPFVDLPSGKSRWGSGVTADEMHEMRWVNPKLVCQVRFVEWTSEGRLRHAVYLGLRSDKNAADVHREDLTT